MASSHKFLHFCKCQVFCKFSLSVRCSVRFSGVRHSNTKCYNLYVSLLNLDKCLLVSVRYQGVNLSCVKYTTEARHCFPLIFTQLHFIMGLPRQRHFLSHFLIVPLCLSDCTTSIFSFFLSPILSLSL